MTANFLSRLRIHALRWLAGDSLVMINVRRNDLGQFEAKDFGRHCIILNTEIITADADQYGLSMGISTASPAALAIISETCVIDSLWVTAAEPDFRPLHLRMQDFYNRFLDARLRQWHATEGAKHRGAHD